MDAVDENGRTALLLAAAAGRHRAVAVLLNDQHQQGAGAAGAVVLRSDVHFPDRSGLRALHLAARDGHTETVKVLLRCGADVHVARLRRPSEPPRSRGTPGWRPRGFP